MASCKYEDGPLVSLISPANRVIGDYHLDAVMVDGIDEMAAVKPLNINYFHIDNTKPFIGGEGTFSVKFSDNSQYNGSSWTLIYPDNTAIDIGNLGCYNPQTIPPPIAPLPGFLTDGTCQVPKVTWEITKLSNKCLWLSTFYNNIYYEVHLKQ